MKNEFVIIHEWEFGSEAYFVRTEMHYDEFVSLIDDYEIDEQLDSDSRLTALCKVLKIDFKPEDGDNLVAFLVDDAEDIDEKF